VHLTPRHYSYLKISEGCNHKCRFCIIPDMRGPLVSRPAHAVLREAERLVAAGVRELIVISQDTSAYGLDPATTPIPGRGGRCAATSPTSPANSARSAHGCGCTTSTPIRMCAT
jgi:ribosomal protein S12 methylthiotransferase